MRIELVKANPYHDKKGRFAHANSRMSGITSYGQKGEYELKFGSTPAGSAKNFVHLSQTDSKHIMSRASVAIQAIAHAHDIPYAKARDILRKAGFDKDKGNSAIHAANLWAIQANHPILNSKPSSAEFKSAISKIPKLSPKDVKELLSGKGHVFKDMADATSPKQGFHGQIHFKDLHALNKKFQTEFRHIAWGTPMAPQSRELAKYVGKSFGAAKAEFKKKHPQPGPGYDLDHKIPKSMYFASSKAAIDYANRQTNFAWMKTSDNRSKGPGMFNKQGKPNWTKISKDDIKHFSHEALLLHSAYEKKNGWNFLTGKKGKPSITAAQLAEAKKNRNVTTWLASYGRKAKALR